MSLDNEELYLIIDTIDASIFWKDTSGRYLGCNQYMVNMSGFKHRSQIIGKKDCDMPWWQIADQLEAIDRSVLEQGIFEGEEAPITAFSKKKKVFHTKKTILYDKHHNIAGIIGISIDITERKKAEQSLQKKQKELVKEKNKAQAANQAKTEFLANMRHDIRTPLSGIVGFSEILKAESNEPRIKEYAENLVASSHALLHLLDEVLDAIKVSSGDIPLLKKKFNLAETLEHVTQLYSAKAAEKQLALSLSISPALPRFVIGDRVRLHRVALELVGNALNFTDVGQVTIEAKQVKKEQQSLILELTVTDTGLGIPKEKQQEIYVQFKRLTPSYQGIYKGAGLGLYIVKQFMDELGGEIYVTSEPHQGTVFTCLIPLQVPLLDNDSHVDSLEPLQSSAALMIPLNHQNVTASSIPSNGKALNRILVVEDNFIAQTVAKAILTSMDCEVDIAPSGEDALTLCEQHPYDLIFMDIGLGEGLDGYEVTRFIREETKARPHLPIIALTAHGADESKQRCIEAGMDAVLTKPLTQAHARDVLHSFIPSRAPASTPKSTSLRKDLPDSDNELFQLNQFSFLNHEEALKNCGSPEMVQELLNLMKRDLPKDLAVMKQAYSVQDFPLVEKTAHKIKGGAVYVGTARMKYACQYLERYWKSGERTLFDALYHQAVCTIEETLTYIEGWMNKNSS